MSAVQQIDTQAPSKWEVLTSIRRTQLQTRLAWQSAKVRRGPSVGVTHSVEWIDTKGNIAERALFADFICNEKGELTIIPSFASYAHLWMRADKINPFSFYFWHNSVTMQTNTWFVEYYDMVMLTLDEQLVMWGTDECTRNSRIFKSIVTYAEALRLLSKVI